MRFALPFSNPFPWQKPPMGAGIDWSHPITRRLIGCWVMNENMGTLVNNLALSVDKIGNVNGAIWNAGMLDFDGTDDYVDLGPFDIINGLTELSIFTVCSFKKATADEALFCKCINSSTWYDETVLLFGDYQGVSRDNCISWYIAVNSTQYRLEASTDSKKLGVKQTIAATLGNSMMRLYINGIEDSNSPISGPSSLSTSMNMNAHLGIVPYDLTKDLGGEMIIFYLWKRELKKEEIEFLHIYPYAFFLWPGLEWWASEAAGQIYELSCSEVFNPELVSKPQIEMGVEMREVIRPDDLGAGPLSLHHQTISDLLLKDRNKLFLILNLANEDFSRHGVKSQHSLVLNQKNSEFIKISSSNTIVLSINNVLKNTLKALGFFQTLNYIDESIVNTLKILENIRTYSVLSEKILSRFEMSEFEIFAFEFIKQVKSALSNISCSNYLSYIDVDISSVAILAEEKLSYLEQILQSYNLLKLDKTASVNFNILQSIMEMASLFAFTKFFSLLDASLTGKFGVESEDRLHPIIRPRVMNLLVGEEKIVGTFEISSQLGQAVSFLEKNGINLVLALEIIARSYYLSILSYAVTELGIEEFDFTIKVRDRICEVKVSKNELTVKVSREQ